MSSTLDLSPLRPWVVQLVRLDGRNMPGAVIVSKSAALTPKPALTFSNADEWLGWDGGSFNHLCVTSVWKILTFLRKSDKLASWFLSYLNETTCLKLKGKCFVSEIANNSRICETCDKEPRVHAAILIIVSSHLFCGPLVKCINALTWKLYLSTVLDWMSIIPLVNGGELLKC